MQGERVVTIGGQQANTQGNVRRCTSLTFGGMLLAMSLALGFSAHTTAQAFVVQSSGLPLIGRAELPLQGQKVLTRIENGDAFDHEKDGSVFGNRERLLPKQIRGYYREYTVPTPGLKHRGAKRIVCGGKVKQRPDACFYTDDHYASFRLIAQ